MSMIHKRSSGELVFAVFPSTRGFGYAVFEGPRSLVDWGVKGVRAIQKNAESLKRIRELLTFYHPDVVVLEDYDGLGSRRAKRVQTLINLITAFAAEEGMATACFSRAEVRACFSPTGSTTKRQIAESVAREFPELERRLAPVRKIWMCEDSRMNIFDAAALGMTYFHTGSRLKRAA
jgi:Holliday junction resolvasome RuvABC endonuclease subunit